MIDPQLKDKEGLPLTCRAVFIIGMTLFLFACDRTCVACARSVGVCSGQPMIK